MPTKIYRRSPKKSSGKGVDIYRGIRIAEVKPTKGINSKKKSPSKHKLKR